jgi:hypothetical protein
MTAASVSETRLREVEQREGATNEINAPYSCGARTDKFVAPVIDHGLGYAPNLNGNLIRDGFDNNGFPTNSDPAGEQDYVSPWIETESSC